MKFKDEQSNNLEKMFLSFDIADQMLAFDILNKEEFGQIFFDFKEQLNEAQNDYDYYIENNKLKRMKRLTKFLSH